MAGRDVAGSAGAALVGSTATASVGSTGATLVTCRRTCRPGGSPTETRTPDAWFKVKSDNHFTIVVTRSPPCRRAGDVGVVHGDRIRVGYGQFDVGAVEGLDRAGDDIPDVDCTAEGEQLCKEFGIQGYPTLKWGDPSDLQDYNGGRSYEDLKQFADEYMK